MMWTLHFLSWDRDRWNILMPDGKNNGLDPWNLVTEKIDEKAAAELQECETLYQIKKNSTREYRIWKPEPEKRSRRTSTIQSSTGFHERWAKLALCFCPGKDTTSIWPSPLFVTLLCWKAARIQKTYIWKVHLGGAHWYPFHASWKKATATCNMRNYELQLKWTWKIFVLTSSSRVVSPGDGRWIIRSQINMYRNWSLPLFSCMRFMGVLCSKNVLRCQNHCSSHEFLPERV